MQWGWDWDWDSYSYSLSTANRNSKRSREAAITLLGAFAMVNSNGCATHSPASLAKAPGASPGLGIGGRSVVRFDVHLGRDWPMEWLLQLLAVVYIFAVITI